MGEMLRLQGYHIKESVSSVRADEPADAETNEMNEPKSKKKENGKKNSEAGKKWRTKISYKNGRMKE